MPDYNFISVIANDSCNFYFVKSGIGKKKAISTVRKICSDFKPHLIISSGCCGGLKSYIKPYSIFSPVEALSENNKSCRLLSLRSKIYKSSIFEGKSFSVKKPADKGKKLLIAKYHPEAFFVDMETYWVAKTSKDLGIRCSSLRISVDGLKNNIPTFSKTHMSISKVKNFFLKLIYEHKASKAMRKLSGIIEELLFQY